MFKVLIMPHTFVYTLWQGNPLAYIIHLAAIIGGHPLPKMKDKKEVELPYSKYYNIKNKISESVQYFQYPNLLWFT